MKNIDRIWRLVGAEYPPPEIEKVCGRKIFRPYKWLKQLCLLYIKENLFQSNSFYLDLFIKENTSGFGELLRRLSGKIMGSPIFSTYIIHFRMTV